MDRTKRQVETTARGLGATVTWTGGKHHKATLHFANGGLMTFSVSKGRRNDPYKIQGWLRQQVRQRLR